MLLINKEIIMLTAGVMWLFGVPLVAVILIYFLILRRR
ncbi:putative membrane protein [Brucella thiophenivorans]|uniref:Putative membrane protein n=1 Tax=Brucella thiophenivorans TaxID=571255 RepID=A0A256FYX7_9HYPH|nr:putative membrane protein [Brucella thiophenivorans]